MLIAGSDEDPPRHVLNEDLLERLAVATESGGGFAADLLASVADLTAELDAVALPLPDRTPYSRRVLHADDRIEVMVARWHPGERCAPHDHGGSQGVVTAVTGAFHERRFTWSGDRLTVADELFHERGEAFAFGSEVVHDMEAGADGGLTLHVYAPPPARMNVYDLDRSEVLDLVGSYGAWIPDDDPPRTSFAEAAAASDLESLAGSEEATQPEMIWIGHTTHYRGGSDAFAVAAATMGRERAAAHPDAEVRVVALRTKADFVGAMEQLAADGRLLRELHFVGHSGMYGIMFGSVEWPEQLSPHEWRQLTIPFAPAGRAAFHACRTARWFAPFFARTFGVPAAGNHGYTTVSTRPDRFAWAGRHPAGHDDLYLIATPGRKSQGLLGSVRKYRGALMEPMLESLPSVSVDRSYDKVAELYDQAYLDITVREAEWAWIENHARVAVGELGAPLRMAEIGCGNGALLRRLDDDGLVAAATGFDDSAVMVDRARARSADRSHLRFERIDDPHLDLADDSIDVALSFLSFRYLDWDPLMDEVRRVLAPGGRLWVVDMVERPVRVRELPLLARSAVAHLRTPRRHPDFVRDVATLTSHPDWKAMVAHNPIRAEHEYRWYLESRFPAGRLEVLTVTAHQRVVAFDSGPLDVGSHLPLAYP